MFKVFCCLCTIILVTTTTRTAETAYREDKTQELRPVIATGNVTPGQPVRNTNSTLTRLIDNYQRNNNWAELKFGLKRLLNTNSSPYMQVLNISDDVQYPLKQMSTTTGYLDLLSVLLNGGLEPNTAAGPDNWTMLHFAAENGTTSVAKMLLRCGADHDARTSTRDTPVIIAAWRDNLAVVKALKGSGANLNAQNDDGRTALHRAAFWGNADVVRYLVDSGANKTVTTKLGNTPLDDARSRGYLDIIEILS